MAAARALKLFPNPSVPPSSISPHTLPGINPGSTKALKRVLEDNQQKHHIYFNDMGFHNHITHRALAVWALGADEDTIQAHYKGDASYQRPAFESPEPITSDNFNDHLGDRRFYDAYLKYFIGQLNEKGIANVIEESIFSSAANFGSKGKSGEHPEMLNRFLDGILHPMIHVGYGVEFNLPGMVAEGLAQTATHKASSTVLIPPSLFGSDVVPSVGSVTARLQSLATGTTGKTSSPHAFSTLSRVSKDESIKAVPEVMGPNRYNVVLENSGEAIYKHVNDWADFDASDSDIVKRKVEELLWTNVLIYALPGFQAGTGNDAGFMADFITMHLVTSSLFLPSLIASLVPSSQHLLMRSYFAYSLGWYVSQGKVPLDIEKFFAADTAHPVLDTSSPNPWLAIINQAIKHSDDHLPKIQRALGHFSALYGSRVAGDAEFSATELRDADKLDGTLFIRAAGLTAKRLGREQGAAGGAANIWDRL
ncbi:hypothetical protein V5O48_008677 [Marasmius crinis-equi]|uniref:Oxidoreductase AflY n=1 Tax=Marasmius crinis-equi TaxID=585013 RepID=A0ABR3FDE9_9AGAR